MWAASPAGSILPPSAEGRQQEASPRLLCGREVAAIGGASGCGGRAAVPGGQRSGKGKDWGLEGLGFWGWGVMVMGCVDFLGDEGCWCSLWPWSAVCGGCRSFGEAMGNGDAPPWKWGHSWEMGTQPQKWGTPRKWGPNLRNGGPPWGMGTPPPPPDRLRNQPRGSLGSDLWGEALGMGP